MATIAERNANPTPGPWTVEQDEGGLYIRMESLAGADEYLAIYASPNPGQREADARLIAAAPALLEAAKAAQACLKAVYGQQLEGDDEQEEPQHSTQLLLATAIAAASGGA